MTDTRATIALIEKALLYATENRMIVSIEATAAALLAARVTTPGGLSVAEAKTAWRILHRIRPLLDGAGIELPGPTAKTPPKAAVPPQVAIRPDGRIGVTGAPISTYGALQVTAHALQDKGAGQWCVAAAPAAAAGVLAVLDGHNPQVSPWVRALADKWAELPALRAEFLDPASPVPDLATSHLVLRKPWDHQVRGAAFAVNTAASMLAMPMGSGKTLTTIAAVNTWTQARVLICCPNKVRGVWPREVAEHSGVDWHIVTGKRPSKRRGVQPQDLTIASRLVEAEENLFNCDCGMPIHAAVFNYEMLAHDPVRSWSPEKVLDVIVYDEGHRLKSPTGVVSKTAARWVNFSRQRIALSGTPTPQNPWDIFGLYRALDPGIFGTTWTRFKNEFVFTRERDVGHGKTQEFPVQIKPEKAREFADRMHSIMYCPEGIDLDLPPVVHITREVELEPAARKAYWELDELMCADLRAFAKDPAQHAELTPKNLIGRMLRLMQCTGGTVPGDEEAYLMRRGVRVSVAELVEQGEIPDQLEGVELRRELKKLGCVWHRDTFRVSRAKADAVTEILDEVGCVSGRDGGAIPVIVYCQFRADLDAVREVADNAGLRYAEISGRRSDGLTQESLMTPNADVVGVQIQSGGTGVDLTRSHYGIWYSTGHSVGDYEQALKRQDRPGQTMPVTFIHLVCPGTIDEQVYRALAQKSSVVASFLLANGVDPQLVGSGHDDTDFDYDVFDHL